MSLDPRYVHQSYPRLGHGGIVGIVGSQIVSYFHASAAEKQWVFAVVKKLNVVANWSQSSKLWVFWPYSPKMIGTVVLHTVVSPGYRPQSA